MWFKKKIQTTLLKVERLDQTAIKNIMSTQSVKGPKFEGLSDKAILLSDMKRSALNPVFEITNHKVHGFKIRKDKTILNVYFNDENVGSIKKDGNELISDESLNADLIGYVSGGIRKYIDSNENGNLKLYTKESRYVLELEF